MSVGSQPWRVMHSAAPFDPEQLFATLAAHGFRFAPDIDERAGLAGVSGRPRPHHRWASSANDFSFSRPDF